MRVQRTFRALAAVAAIFAVPGGTALAGKQPACAAPARFIATKSPLVAGQVDEAGFFSVTVVPTGTAATVSVPGCEPTSIKLKGSRVKAKWASCTGLGGQVKLAGKIASNCTVLRGQLAQKKGSPKHRGFRATLSACGDDLLDSSNNELCDGDCGTGCDPQTCTCAGKTGGSGAFGIITVNGTQKMYLPQRRTNAAGHGVVSVVNVGVAGNGVAGAPALITDIDLGTSDTATATGGDSLTVIAASTENRSIWFIDPRKDQIVGTLMLDSSFGTSNFSGGGGYVTGIAIDSLNRRAILSVWNGFILIDLSTRSIVGSVNVPPSENFGFDNQTQRIIAPFYDCREARGGTGTPPRCDLPMTPDGRQISEGLLVVDLANGNATYTFQDPTDPTSPVGREPDSAAADSSTGIVVIPEEGGPVHVIDLSQGMFTAGSVTAPHRVLDPTLNRLTGVAIEPVNHIAFLEAEFDTNVGFLKLDTLATLDAAITESTMPGLPGGSTFRNLGDPHGIAVTTGILDGGPVGFVVDSSLQWVGRVDLAKVFTLPSSANVIADTDLATAVTYLDARTMP